LTREAETRVLNIQSPHRAKFSKDQKASQHPTSPFEFRPYQTAGERRLCGAQRTVAGAARASAMCPKRPSRMVIGSLGSPASNVLPADKFGYVRERCSYSKRDPNPAPIDAKYT